VFPNPHGGVQNANNFRRRVFVPACRAVRAAGRLPLPRSAPHLRRADDPRWRGGQVPPGADGPLIDSDDIRRLWAPLPERESRRSRCFRRANENEAPHYCPIARRRATQPRRRNRPGCRAF
jgi:hypothetical protein